MSNKFWGSKNKEPQKDKKSLLDYFSSSKSDTDVESQPVNESQSFISSTFSKVKSQIVTQAPSLTNISDRMQEVQQAANTWK